MIIADQWNTGDDFSALQLAFKRKGAADDFRGLEALLGSLQHAQERTEERC